MNRVIEFLKIVEIQPLNIKIPISYLNCSYESVFEGDKVYTSFFE